MSEPLLRIGQLAAQAGVSPRTVDYYTSLGLLIPAARTDGNFRLYAPEAIGRIATVQRLEAHGISLEDIVAALRAPATGLGVALDQLGESLRALHAALEAATPQTPTPQTPTPQTQGLLETQGLLAAITARAHGLIVTALDLAAAAPSHPG